MVTLSQSGALYWPGMCQNKFLATCFTKQKGWETYEPTMFLHGAWVYDSLNCFLFLGLLVFVGKKHNIT